MRPKDTATRRKRSSEIQRCTKLDSLQRHPHDEAKVRSKQAASRSAPENSVSADSFATSKTVGEVESHHNDFDRYIVDQENMFHDRDPQFSSSGAICGTPETLSWLDQQFIPGAELCTKQFDHLLGFISQAAVTSQSSDHQTLPQKSRQITADPTAIEATFLGGNFWNHIVSKIVRDPQQSLFAYWEVGTPLPIALQHARQLILDVWSGVTMSGWVDRFGNTSLHFAAFCGASLPHLLCLMEHVDAEVNAVNNAGQTFMHVLDPDSLSPEDMIALRDQLILDGFIFHYRDVEGQTFLDTLKYGFMQSGFARCWLRPIIRKDKPFHGFSVETTSEQLLDGRLVRKIFNEIGGHEEQWKMLGWESNSYQHLHCSSNINELLEPSYNPMLLKTKDCWDRLGRGLLHIAADDMAGPATPTEAQQRRSNAMRLNLVKHLLSIGVDVNHHDHEGVTPLMAHVRCETYQHAIVDELLQHGAEPNARDSSGNTALHIAIKLGNMDATKILLGRGANVHARNRKCEGLLTVAKRAQRGAKDDVGLYAKITACMALIIDAGAIASPNLIHEWDTAQMNGSYDTHGSNSSWARRVFLDPTRWGSDFIGWRSEW
ncbi:MAG: hypothetical protein L6R36_003289 [Xanthoria steineri]|nr:MAG: hypothetical protein L6R36_003289 [Xanthoria steineri]